MTAEFARGETQNRQPAAAPAAAHPLLLWCQPCLCLCADPEFEGIYRGIKLKNKHQSGTSKACKKRQQHIKGRFRSRAAVPCAA